MLSDGTPRYEDTCIYAILNKEMDGTARAEAKLIWIMPSRDRHARNEMKKTIRTNDE